MTWVSGKLEIRVLGANNSHGDLLFLSYKPLSALSSPAPAPAPPAISTGGRNTEPAAAPPAATGTAPSVDLNKVVEQDVDTYWSSQNGKIERKRDATFCRHGEKGMCDYCMPLEVSASDRASSAKP